MADIDMTSGATTRHLSRAGNTKVPYLVEVTVDFAEALTAKGSALAAADVIQALDVPAETMILNAGLEVLTVDDSTTLTLDVGTGDEVDTFVDGFDHAAAAAGAYAQNAAAFQPLVVGGTADTIDVVLATLTGTLTVGSFRLFAVLLDVSSAEKPGLVALGS